MSASSPGPVYVPRRRQRDALVDGARRQYTPRRCNCELCAHFGPTAGHHDATFTTLPEPRHAKEVQA